MVTIGADPEVFLTDAAGHLVSSIGVIGGDKGAGVPIHKDLGKNFTWLEDNVAVEFNWPAHESPTGFLEAAMYARDYARKTLAPKKLELLIAPHAKFPKAQLLCDKANTFGCEPDFEAYEYGPKKAPDPRIVDVGDMKDNRFAGGHIHLGFDNKNKIPAHAVAILMDMYIGLPSVSRDNQGLRRAYYGRAGLYRPKDYGIEYRTMSNWWLHQDRADDAHNMAYEIFYLGRSLEAFPDELAKVFDKIPIHDVRQIINSQDQKGAYQLWHQLYSYTRHRVPDLARNFQPKMKTRS
jgi:hypothetical protein